MLVVAFCNALRQTFIRKDRGVADRLGLFLCGFSVGRVVVELRWPHQAVGVGFDGLDVLGDQRGNNGSGRNLLPFGNFLKGYLILLRYPKCLSFSLFHSRAFAGKNSSR